MRSSKQIARLSSKVLSKDGKSKEGIRDDDIKWLSSISSLGAESEEPTSSWTKRLIDKCKRLLCLH